MFSNERYLTREVANKLPIEIQLLMWQLIEELKVKKDYLQVFELTPIERDLVEIIHRQEIPKFTCEIVVKNKNIKEKMKIFVINDIEYSTMMFSDEY